MVPLAAAPQGPPSDGEVRTRRDAFTNETLTTLTLILRGPKGQLPINMVITVVEKAGKAGSPGEIRLDFEMPLFVGTPDYRRPHLVVTLNRDAPKPTVETFSVDPKTPLVAGLSRVSMPFSAGALARFAEAETVHGRIFGLDFELTPKQRQAIRSFAARGR